MIVLRDLLILTGRLLKHTWRMPVFALISIVQPIIWLTLFGHLFENVTLLEGFGDASYVTFLIPGLAVMSALFGSAYSGMALLMDSERGILDRFLVTPAARGALIGAYIAQSGIIVTLQATSIILVGLLIGAQMPGGFIAYLVILLAAFLIGSAFGALSNALALTVPRHDAIIAVMNFTILPLVFMSSMMIATDAMPGWIAQVAAFNPVNWAVEMARGAFFANDWTDILTNAVYLGAFSLFCVLLTMRAFSRFMQKA